MIGVVSVDEARDRAREAELDLVEISPEADPPVCRILDYGKYRYEQSKKEKAQKARSKTLEMKEVRLGRSMKIDPHDIEIRLNKARQFLNEGHKVQIVQNFRGREMMHRDRGFDRMKDIVEKLSDIAKLEVPPRMAGRRVTMILAPDKAKLDRIKHRAASSQHQPAQSEDKPETDESESSPAKEPKQKKPDAVEEKAGIESRSA